MKGSRWKTKDLTKTYLEGIRGALPFAGAQIELIIRIVRSLKPGLTSFLDLGCGDGILGRAVLDSFPDTNGVFMDFSEPMIEAAIEKIGIANNVRLIKGDFSSRSWLAACGQNQCFDLVISGLAIHHQPDDRKRELYGEIFEVLNPGGVFLNLEHVASLTDRIKSISDEYFIDHLHEFHRLDDPNVTREQVSGKYYNRPDKDENILTPLEIQCEWLRRIGFTDVDCFFKIFEIAILGGRKPDQ